MASALKSFVQFQKGSRIRTLEGRLVALSSIFVAYIFFFRLARSNLVPAWAVSAYVILSILCLAFSSWLDYFPMRMKEIQLRLFKNSGMTLGCMLVPMTITALLVCVALRSPRHETLLSLFVILSIALSAMSILATLFYGLPNPTNLSMYMFAIIGASYGISAVWQATLPSVTPPAPLFLHILCVSFLFTFLVSWILNSFEGSFTLCEACTIGQGISLSCYDVILQILNAFGFIALPSNLIVPRSEILTLLQMVVFAGVMCSLVCLPLYSKLEESRADPASLRFWSATIYLVIIGLSVFLFKPALEVLLKKKLFSWFFPYVFHSSKVPLLLYWTLVSGFAILLVVAQSSSSTWLTVFKARNPSSSWFRKWFHLLAMLIFVPGLLVDPALTSLASAGALAVFLILEFVRFLRMWPCGDSLHSYLACLTDSKDQGPLVLTHIYLLLGFALPLWLYPLTSYGKGWPKISLYSGVLALGVGDSLASIVGKSFGKWKISGSEKTVEGTLASVAGQLIAVVVLSYVDPAVSAYYYSPYDYACLVGSIAACSLLEALTWQIDNLILPLYLFSLLLVSYT